MLCSYFSLSSYIFFYHSLFSLSITFSILFYVFISQSFRSVHRHFKFLLHRSVSVIRSMLLFSSLLLLSYFSSFVVLFFGNVTGLCILFHCVLSKRFRAPAVNVYILYFCLMSVQMVSIRFAPKCIMKQSTIEEGIGFQNKHNQQWWKPEKRAGWKKKRLTISALLKMGLVQAFCQR